MPHKTDREIAAELHTKIAQTTATVRGLARHAPHAYIRDLIERATTLLEAAHRAWREEEQQAGTPLWH